MTQQKAESFSPFLSPILFSFVSSIAGAESHSWHLHPKIFHEVPTLANSADFLSSSLSVKKINTYTWKPSGNNRSVYRLKRKGRIKLKLKTQKIWISRTFHFSWDEKKRFLNIFFSIFVLRWSRTVRSRIFIWISDRGNFVVRQLTFSFQFSPFPSYKE